MLPNKVAYSPALNDDTKILTETDTETFFTIPNFPKPKPRLFSETKFFRNRDFFSETKFSKTETETFFSETETETLKKLVKVSNREVSQPKCQSLVKVFERYPTLSF